MSVRIVKTYVRNFSQGLKLQRIRNRNPMLIILHCPPKAGGIPQHCLRQISLRLKDVMLEAPKNHWYTDEHPNFGQSIPYSVQNTPPNKSTYPEIMSIRIGTVHAQRICGLSCGEVN